MSVDIWDQKWKEDLSVANYEKNGMTTVKQVADMVLPLVFAALCIIPGGAVVAAVGNMAAAVFSVLWSTFGGEVGEEDKRKEAELVNKIIDISQKVAKREVSTEVRKRINAAFQTSGYVCSKFSIGLSGWYNTTDQDRKKEIGHNLVSEFNACDNFQKNIVTQLDNTGYPDMLLPLIAIMTSFFAPLARECVDHCISWSMQEAVVEKITKDSYKRIDSMINAFGRGLINKHNNGYPDIYALEGEACMMQRSHLYYNKELYKYGVPWRNDLNGTSPIDDQKHLQYFVLAGMHYKNQLNCLMGPKYVLYNPSQWGGHELNMKVGKTGTYKIRALYYINPDNEDVKHNQSPSFSFKHENKSFKNNEKVLKKYTAPIIFAKSGGYAVLKRPNTNPENSKFVIKEIGTSHFEKGKEYHMRASTRFNSWTFVGFELIIQ
jgi:hypothetical protein